MNTDKRSGDSFKERITTVLMEAMYCGLSVVATYHAGIPELVIDEVNGYLVPEKDEDLLAERILVPISMKPEERRKMGMSGRQQVEHEFNREVQAKRLEEIYDDLINMNYGEIGNYM